MILSDFLKIGPFNISGEWSGVMGDVVTGKYHIALSTWYSFYERKTVVDLDVMIQWDFFIAAIILKSQKMDPGLFIRPFSRNAWILIVTIFAFQMIIISFSSFLTKTLKQYSIL